MAFRTELVFVYDQEMFPITATCTHCGEQMPSPDADLEFPADIILWLSVQFLEHKRGKHPSSKKQEIEQVEPAAFPEARSTGCTVT